MRTASRPSTYTASATDGRGCALVREVEPITLAGSSAAGCETAPSVHRSRIPPAPISATHPHDPREPRPRPHDAPPSNERRAGDARTRDTGPGSCNEAGAVPCRGPIHAYAPMRRRVAQGVPAGGRADRGVAKHPRGRPCPAAVPSRHACCDLPRFPGPPLRGARRLVHARARRHEQGARLRPHERLRPLGVHHRLRRARAGHGDLLPPHRPEPGLAPHGRALRALHLRLPGRLPPRAP